MSTATLENRSDIDEQLDASHELHKAFETFSFSEEIEGGFDINDKATNTSDFLTFKDFFIGLTQLTTTSVVETSEIVEAIHREIMLRPIGRLNPKHIQNWQYSLTGRIYQSIRSITLMVSRGLFLGVKGTSKLATLQQPQIKFDPKVINESSKQPTFKQTIPIPTTSKTFVNILNGVMGDHLVAHKNPLALPMRFYSIEVKPYVFHKVSQQQPICIYPNKFKKSYLQSVQVVQHTDAKKITGRVVILIHGLCMSYAHWQPKKKNGLGRSILRDDPTATVLFLDYNTGERISNNGRKFSQLLQSLVENNPDISQIDLIGHSMGGLVCRSALFYGQLNQHSWVDRSRKLITLGTPHHGSGLERIGAFVQNTISKLPFAGSLAKLGDIRSAGIIDLRHGSIRDADWQSLDTRSMLPDSFRHPTELPADMHTYFIAGTLMENPFGLKAKFNIGDGLVSLASALGEHTEEHTLFVPEGHKAVFYGTHHQQLVKDAGVHRKVIEWLNDDGSNALGERYESYENDLNLNFDL